MSARYLTKYRTEAATVSNAFKRFIEAARPYASDISEYAATGDKLPWERCEFAAELFSATKHMKAPKPVVTAAEEFFDVLRNNPKFLEVETLTESRLNRIAEAEALAILAKDKAVLDALNKLLNMLIFWKY